MLTRTRKIYVGAVVIYLLVIIGQMAYAVYDNALISKNNVFAFEYLFNTVQPFGVDETMIGAIAKTGSCWPKSKSWHFPP